MLNWNRVEMPLRYDTVYQWFALIFQCCGLSASELPFLPATNTYFWQNCKSLNQFCDPCFHYQLHCVVTLKSQYSLDVSSWGNNSVSPICSLAAACFHCISYNHVNRVKFIYPLSSVFATFQSARSRDGNRCKRRLPVQFSVHFNHFQMTNS